MRGTGLFVSISQLKKIFNLSENLSIHLNFFPTNNHFVGKVMKLNTDFGVQSQPARVKNGVTEKKKMHAKIET